MEAAEKVVRRVDEAHQRHPWLAFPYAVIKKFGDDQAGNLAALISYYAFFSLFPLMLVLVTVLGMVLQRNTELREAIQESALANFPVVGEEISRNVRALDATGLTLAVGIALAVWAGLGVLKVMQTAMNTIWNVPYRHRPNFLKTLLRAVIMLAVLGVITIGSAVAGGIGAGNDNLLLSLVWVLVSLVLNLALFLLAFRILTSADVTSGDVFPGALVAAIAWTALQALGGYFVRHQLEGATETYGTFATVIGLLAWMYLGAQATLLAAEVNVVRKRRLWPRAIVQPPLTDADERALKIYAKVEERRPEEDVYARIDRAASTHPPSRDEG
ncbi:MAG TPA: YihY/virulence factor BrkB family protein [Actinomycetota bacterium]|nr:YihY/virulence factor BrkB family protein [Actinomycetota bacterium]